MDQQKLVTKDWATVLALLAKEQARAYARQAWNRPVWGWYWPRRSSIPKPSAKM